MMEANLRTLLPPGTVTFPTFNETGGTAIYLVWGNENAEDILLKCHTIEQTNDHGLDHHPIEIVLDLSLKKLPPTAYAYNYNKTNWELSKLNSGLAIGQENPISRPKADPRPTRDCASRLGSVMRSCFNSRVRSELEADLIKVGSGSIKGYKLPGKCRSGYEMWSGFPGFHM